MKTLLLSLTLLITFPAFSQHYRTVATDSEVYFDFKDVNQLIYNDNQEEIKPCRVILTDNFQMLNNETVIYHQFNQEFERQYETYYDSTQQWYFTDCFSTNDTGFLSYKTILQDDGTDIYFNRFHDSIFIQTQANLNDNWIFYQNNAGHYFEANVSSIAIDNFLGLTDSVKTITLIAKDSLGNTIISPYDTLRIRLSKNYGLIEGFNLFTFPYGTTIGEHDPFQLSRFQTISLIGLPQANVGVKNLTAADVYDYDIGDEYHWVIRTSGGDQNYNYESNIYEKITINSKQFSGSIDTVYYGVHVERYRSSYVMSYPPPYTSQGFDTLFVADTILSYNIVDNHINTYPLHYDTDSVLTWIQSEDGTQKTITYWDGAIWNTSGCNITEIRQAGKTTFHKGIGSTYSRGGVNLPSEERSFVYYNKGGNIWGTPLNIDSLSTVSTNEVIAYNFPLKIFPNPATDLLNFQLEEPINNAEIRIYSTLGQLIETQNINDTNTQFNVSEWQNGMYFYGIFVAGEMVKSGQVLIVE